MPAAGRAARSRTTNKTLAQSIPPIAFLPIRTALPPMAPDCRGRRCPPRDLLAGRRWRWQSRLWPGRMEAKLPTSDDITLLVPPNVTNEGAYVIAQEVRNVQFQYWDGMNWNDTWDSTTLRHRRHYAGWLAAGHIHFNGHCPGRRAGRAGEDIPPVHPHPHLERRLHAAHDLPGADHHGDTRRRP